ncbi:reverse transcriptase domain-containing protein [Tanacetum coccineum]
MKSQQSTNAFVKETFMDLKTQLETVAKNHQASIQNLETKFDKLADKQSGRPSSSLPSNTQPNLKGHNAKAYQPPQSSNEHVNVVFTRSGKSYNPPVNQNDQQNDSETLINFDSDDEDEEPTPQPNPKQVKETQLPKPYKPKIPMPNYGKFLKELISNKYKIEQIFAAFLSDESSAMIQNKVPPKLKDPESFLIPCNFNKAFSCNALADLGASINLMPYSLYVKLSLETLKPTKMSVRLADRSFQYPVGIAKNMLIEVGKFTFPADFVILEMEEDSKVPLILGRPFLYTADAIIRVKPKQLNLGVRTERMIFNIDSAMKHSYSNDDTCFSIDVIDEILKEDFDALLKEGSKILHSIEGTLLEEEIFAEFDEFIAMTTDENSDSESKTKDLPFEKITINTYYKIKTSLEEPPTNLELKPLLDNLEYVFLKEPFFFLLSYNLSLRKKRKTNSYLSLKRTSKPLLRKLLTFLEVIKKEIIKLLDTGIIYPIADSPWVSLIHYVPKKCGITVVTNENDELVPTRTITGWQCHFMVKEGIVLGHKVSSARLEVDKAKIDVISKLPPLPTSKLLKKDTPFEFDDECQKAFKLLKEKLTCAPVIVSSNWNLPFELMCDASDFAVGAVLALRHLFKKQDAKSRLIRWILLLQEFDIEIKDRKGTGNVVADHLSRIENDDSIDDSEVDDNFPGETLMEINTKNEPWFADFANYLVGDIVPKGMTCQQKNKFFSDLKHYFWEEPYPFKVSEIFDIWGIDFMGPFTKSYKFEYILVAVDYVSKWAEAQALPTNDARVVITFLKKLFCRFGMPKALISDRGTHFCNKIMEKPMKRYGVNHRFSTSYHPQTSGQVENTNRALKIILEKTVKDNPAIWSRKLDDALWAFRTAYKTPTGTTPYKLIYGKNCHLPFEIEHRAYWALKNCNPDLIAAGEKRMFQLHELDELRHQAYENSRLYKARTKVWHGKKLRMRKEFKQGNKVLLFHLKYKFKQPKLRSRWLGPYVVTHQYPSRYVKLYGKDGKTFIVNGHRLKLYHEEDNKPREAVTLFFPKNDLRSRSLAKDSLKIKRFSRGNLCFT